MYILNMYVFELNFKIGASVLLWI